MKKTTHMLIGTLAGVLLYLVGTAGSYVCLKWDYSGIGLVLLLCLFVAIVLWNILYKTTTVGAVLLRAAFGTLSYSLVMLGCAYSGMIVMLEEMLGIGSSAQNVQGMITLFLVSSGAIASFFSIVIKCIVLCCQHGKAGKLNFTRA